MTVQSVDCTSDLSPSALGKPSVSDNGGPNITLTYSDIPGGSCSFQRKWTATDLAGNSASKIQVINLSNLQAPTVIYNANTPSLAEVLRSGNKTCARQSTSPIPAIDQSQYRTWIPLLASFAVQRSHARGR